MWVVQTKQFIPFSVLFSDYRMLEKSCLCSESRVYDTTFNTIITFALIKDLNFDCIGIHVGWTLFKQSLNDYYIERSTSSEVKSRFM